MNAIQTARLLLDPLVASHAEAMYAVLSEASLHDYIDSSPPESVDALRQRYLQLEARTSPDQSQIWLNWAVVLPEVGPIGFVQATVIGASAWVAYLLGREYWSRGYASEATVAMLGHLTSVHKIASFKATVEVENANSVALLRRLGFHLASSSEHAGVSLSPTEHLYLKNAGSVYP